MAENVRAGVIKPKRSPEYGNLYHCVGRPDKIG
jgi:hypothetical protein